MHNEEIISLKEQLKDITDQFFARSQECAQLKQERDEASGRADKYWRQLCDTAEALGKVSPEAAPYTAEWAKDLRERFARLASPASSPGQQDWALLAIRALSEYTEHDRGLDKTYADLIRPYAPLAEPARAGWVGEDTRRLDWLCDFITDRGTNAFKKLGWSLYDDEGESLNHLKRISEDDVADLKFDRAAIDRAMSPAKEDKK